MDTIMTGYEDYELGLVIGKNAYYLNSDKDENEAVIMVDNETAEIIAKNHFAYDGFMDDLAKVSAGLEPDYISNDVYMGMKWLEYDGFFE